MENQAIAQRPNERDIQKRFNSRNAISSSILIVIGVFMVSLTLTMHTTDSNILSLVLMVCGGSMAIYGMIRILSHASRTVYAPTGSTIKEYHLYYSPEYFATYHWCQWGSRMYSGKSGRQYYSPTGYPHVGR